MYYYEPGFVHPEFRLNGYHLGANELRGVGYDFIKEGTLHEQPIGDFLLDWFDDKDYVEIRTSGTTGTPKLIRIKKQHMVNSAVATGAFFDVGARTKALHCLPAQYVAGKMMLVRAIILGWRLDVATPGSEPLEKNTKKYDFAAMVPLQAERSFDTLSQVTKIILGGGKVSQALSARLQTLPSEIWETYAMTETVTHIAAKRVGEVAFTTLPDVSVTTDARGCLVISAPNVADTTIVTNDLATVKDAHHFVWLGRHDNVINSGGIKLYPEQIEEKLSLFIKRRFFVYGQPDDTLGERMVLVIEGEPREITDDCYVALDKYEKPKEVVFIPKFSETGTGKIQRAETLKAFQL
ncbi:MAG: AMP-binding protein [Bacteroidia bacterium]